MRFNNYIWNLYKDSKKGQEAILEWQPKTTYPTDKYAIEISKPNLLDKFVSGDLERYVIGSRVNFLQFRYDYLTSTYNFSQANPRDLYMNWIEKGIVSHGATVFPKGQPKFWFMTVEGVSKLLYDVYPEYFFPYIFNCEFDKFKNICDEFSIPIPDVPNKKDSLKRAIYYIDLCDAIYEFRKTNGFKPAELCAFLYDFAPDVMDELEDNELPNPLKVWFVGAAREDFDFLDNATESSENTWQGNIDAKRGDIIVMYCRSPRSYIHSIWRVKSKRGFADPFFAYYSVNRISLPVKLDTYITNKDLEENHIWSQNPLIKKNLQGINGYPIKYNEYLELLKLLESKGQSIEKLPTITPTSKFDTEDLLDERDVEIRLIEPFLIKLRYTSKDWIRQMPVKMGRGERNYPDYCFGANPQRGEESAKMILESKYEIRTSKDLQEAYFQAKSYAIRLQSECFLIASKEGIWIYKPQNGVYSFENHQNYSWIQVEQPDTLHELLLSVGNK